MSDSAPTSIERSAPGNRAPVGRPDDPTMVGVGTAVGEVAYTQGEIIAMFGVDDPRVRGIFMDSAIQRRYLSLLAVPADGVPPVETQGQLLARHTAQGVRMGTEALAACLADCGAGPDDVDFLCCVTTTGFLTPGLSALLIKELGLGRHTKRLDVVGMGCNAGLNALTATVDWARVRPGRLAVMVCVEVCSAAYVFDGTMRTSVVNSLFGDGAAAAALRADPAGGGRGPRLVKFDTCLIPDAIDAMRYDWDDAANKFSFSLDRDVPYVVGAHAELAVGHLLEGTGVRQQDIQNWIVHSGGKKVIDAVRINLGLTRHDLRHTTSVLRDYGNVSSGSFLFSFERLGRERLPAPGELLLMMTMGPGSTIETALAHY